MTCDNFSNKKTIRDLLIKYLAKLLIIKKFGNAFGKLFVRIKIKRSYIIATILFINQK